MKKHHWIVLTLSIAVIGTLLLWPKTHTEDIAINELVGQWHAGGVNADGFEWFMEYTFKKDGTYELVTGTDYTEEGVYEITNRYLDGSIEIKKVFSEGTKDYTMVIVTQEDPDIVMLEGTQLNRIK
ncbi:hypothetical protein HQ487_00185 [Candidatus Uhrbacteria bacterium]|nr:hypothetical protein [Candidatus Uhrbacteria bacterium]